MAGCIGGDGGSSNGDSMTVAILAAGSLQHALENGLKPAVDVPVQVEAHGSATVARLIDEGQRDPDIVTVADTALFEEPLSPPWYSVFTSNSVVIAYNPETDGGQRLADAGADGWYEPMVDGEVSIGRTDPDLDPLGYRTLFTLELASRYYEDASDLQEQILRQEQIYPETSLISQFETGSVDAAFTYRNMAAERDYEYIDLPDQIDLSNPNYNDDWYATVSHTLPSDQEIQGGLISYGSTIRTMSDAAVAVFDRHTTGAYLAESGFILRDQFPMYEGDPPSQLTETTSQSNTSQSIDSLPMQSLAGTVSDITLLI
ncbi:MAG: ABC-type molybdate transport system, periplasmic component [Halonotius sp. J07HN4]|nr:MAG: ABC-type molybdate transport system, periplasmic component [Halonotius sp. J07HN4]